MVPLPIVHASEASVVILAISGPHMPADLAISGDLTVDLETPVLIAVKRGNYLVCPVAGTNPGADGNSGNFRSVVVVQVLNSHVVASA